MQIRVFTLCDGAYNYNGKLTIVGTTDNIKVPRTPAIVSIGLAIKVSFEPNEYGEKRLSVKIIDSENNSVMTPLVLPPTEARARGGEEAKIVLAGNLQGLSVNNDGDYRVVLTINDEDYILPFKVIR